MKRGDLSFLLGITLLAGIAYYIYRQAGQGGGLVQTLRGAVPSQLPPVILKALNTPVPTIVDDLTGTQIAVQRFSDSYPFAGANFGG